MFFLNSLVARQHNSKMVCTFANHLLRHSVYRDYWILMVGEVIDIKITVIPWRLKNNYSGYVTTKECYNERMLQRTMLQRTNATTNECYNERILQRTKATTNECYNERMLQRTNTTTNDATTNERYNELCYNERMLQRTVFINKIRMLQRTPAYDFFLAFIMESSIIFFTKERLFMLFKFTCTVYKS